MGLSVKTWICVQNGAREHYAIPRALKASGRLGALFTEVWAGWLLRRLPFGPLRAMAGRYHAGLEQNSKTLKSEKLKSDVSMSACQLSAFPSQVVSWNFSSALRNVRWRLQKSKMLKAEKLKSDVNISVFQGVSVSAFSYQRFIQDGRWFSVKVRDHLARRNTDLRNTIIFSYDTTALELFRWAKERGAICVLNQMDPGRVETELVRAEERRWPGWANQNAETLKAEILKLEDGSQKAEIGHQIRHLTPALSPVEAERERITDDRTGDGRLEGEGRRAEGTSSAEHRTPNIEHRTSNEGGGPREEEYFRRREEEWKLADRIIVNSRWSFDALVKQGVPAEKLVVVPLCYEVNAEKLKAEILKTKSRKQQADVSVSAFQFSASSPLRVLFLGQVILRKGIQYLVEAAKLLQGEPVHFDVVGPIGISADAIKSAPRNMTFHGRANRDQAGVWYQNADVFVLPTLSDGFALTQLEAMAHGLPVIATPNCGEVVTNGKDGFIVPPRDAVSLAEAIKHYLARPDLLPEQKMAVKEKLRQFALDKLAGRLLELERQSTKRQASVQNISP
jgi:hypothetical protein